MTQPRIRSIDIMRGITLILMLFVNDLYMPGVPEWLGHTTADFDGMGLADWVFPGFLFMVGMAIPYSLSKRISEGQDNFAVSRHIMIRSISLIIIGVLMLNTARVEPVLTGMSRDLWALLMYIGVFLVWNEYRDNGKNFLTLTGFRLAGMALLAFLIFRFKSGQPENEGSLITGWWGILGLIGWGYLIAAFIYLLIKDDLTNNVVAFLFFLTLNCLTKLNLLVSLDPARPVLGVILEGNVPMIILSGVLTSVILRKFNSNHAKMLLIIAAVGIASIAAGFVMREWFIISKIQATPSWGLVCNGISMLLFVFLYLIIDVAGKTAWTGFIRPAGQNSLTTYLAPNIIYHLIWMSGVPLLIYKQSSEPLVVIAGSLAWALLMVGLTALLVKAGVRLKL
jgi:heparan-alpha-glucosaminide N-acetyltransferase